MTTVEQAQYRGAASDQSSPGFAVGGGILAGLVTLGIVTALILALGGGDDSAGAETEPQPGEPVDCLGDHGGAVLRVRDVPRNVENFRARGVGDFIRDGIHVVGTAGADGNPGALGRQPRCRGHGGV